MDTLGLAGPGSASRDGKILVVPSGASLPPYCVKCGALQSTPPFIKTFRWHSSWVYLLILVGLIFYVIVALIVQKKVRMEVPFCQEHRSWRARMNTTGAVLLLGFIPMSFLLAAIGVDGVAIAFIAIAMAFSGLVIFGIVGGSFSPVYIDEGCAKFKGAGEQFLSLLSNDQLATSGEVEKK